MIKQTVAVVAMATALHVVPAVAQKPMTATNFIQAQQADDWRASNIIGEDVKNASDEVIGDINDLVFGNDGKVHAVVIGVGGFLGIGEKDVAVPYSALTIKPSKDGDWVITAALDKAALEKAPEFKSLDDQKGGVTGKMQREISKWSEKAKETAKDVGDKAKAAYSDAKTKAKEAYSDTKTKAKETYSDAKEKAAETKEEMTEPNKDGTTQPK